MLTVKTVKGDRKYSMNLRDRINKKYLQISLYVIFTAIVIYILSLIAKNAMTIIGFIMEKLLWFLRVIRPLILGFVFAYLMEPVVSFFEERFRRFKLFKRMKRPRTWAGVFSVLLFFIALAGLVSLLIYSVTDQLRLANFDDVIALAEGYLKSLDSFYNSILASMKKWDIQSNQFEQYVENTLTVIINALQDFAESTLNAVKNMSGYLTTIIFGFIIGFYFIIDGRMFTLFLKKTGDALLSKNVKRKISAFLKDLDYAFSGYIRGQLTDALVMMVLISLTLSITGVKFALVIGIFAGIGNLIPYFGPIIAYISTALVCIINGEMQRLIISIILLIVIQFIDGNFIGPKLLSRSIKIHPLIIIVSLIFGSAVGGFLGMLLAVPVGAYLKLVFVRFIENRALKKSEEEKVAEDNQINSKKD